VEEGKNYAGKIQVTQNNVHFPQDGVRPSHRLIFHLCSCQLARSLRPTPSLDFPDAIPGGIGAFVAGRRAQAPGALAGWQCLHQSLMRFRDGVLSVRTNRRITL